MISRFGQFELDAGARTLRLNGEEIPLQPRVFDLLALLHRHRDRVIGKEELLETLWPGVIVGDGSLQRAVSLARSALKKGGLGDALRNYARQGYRLCLDGDEPAETMPGAEALATARDAFERRDWDTAVTAYRIADDAKALEAADLERLADALQCSGRASETEAVLERAMTAWSARGDHAGAARAALYLAELNFEAAKLPVARGWLARARRLLEGCTEAWEHGFEACVSARMAVATGDPASGIEHGRRALDIAGRIGSDAIDALGRIYVGYGLIALGDAVEGMRLVDEAATVLLSGNIGPRTGGNIYCGLIWLCCNRGDWQRAAQWSDSFLRWCEREGITRFSGLCQLHRAEVLSISGEASAAEQELRVACDQLLNYSPFAAGDAFRILGDLFLMRGELDQADAAFRRAHDLGWDPQPGLAMLQAERGDGATAIRGLLRSLHDTNWAVQQRRGLLLAVLVIIASQQGERDQARQAMQELDAHPELWATEFHGGAVARARAEIAMLEGNMPEAVARMRDAVRCWRSANAGLNLATCRLRLAQILAADGDIANATLELDAAETCFRDLQAQARVGSCAGLRQALAGARQA